MDTLPWYAWVAIIVAIGWAAMVVIGATGYGRSKRSGGDPLGVIAENSAVNKAILERLDTIDSRLGMVEKTLNEIPS